jgi:hypothetical protein
MMRACRERQAGIHRSRSRFIERLIVYIDPNCADGITAAIGIGHNLNRRSDGCSVGRFAQLDALRRGGRHSCAGSHKQHRRSEQNKTDGLVQRICVRRGIGNTDETGRNRQCRKAGTDIGQAKPPVMSLEIPREQEGGQVFNTRTSTGWYRRKYRGWPMGANGRL